MIDPSNERAVMFPKERSTKGDRVDYYLEVAAVMLPHLENRPLTVERFTKGIGARGFIQKNASEHYPEWTCAEGSREASELSPVGVVLAAVAANAGGTREFLPPLCAETTDYSD